MVSFLYAFWERIRMFSNFLINLSKQKLSVAIQKAHHVMLVAVVSGIILGISLSPQILFPTPYL